MEKKLAMRVSWISIIINVVLSLLKMIAGFVAHSGAMLSDAVHSASDVISTFIVMIGVNISSRASDREHPYGHERMECIASIVLAVILFITGLKIGLSGMEKIFSDDPAALQTPGLLALIAAALSIAVKEWMYHFTRRAAKKIHSSALMADAWHHRSDALSSIGSFIGIFGARLGLPVLDPIAGVVICFFIGKAAYDIFVDACSRLVDQACDDETVQKIRSAVMSVDGVCGIDDMKTRKFANKIYIDVEISADGDLHLSQSHAIAENVHQTLEHEFPDVKHCMVHVNPAAKAGVGTGEENGDGDDRGCSPL